MEMLCAFSYALPQYCKFLCRQGGNFGSLTHGRPFVNYTNIECEKIWQYLNTFENVNLKCTPFHISKYVCVWGAQPSSKNGCFALPISSRLRQQWMKYADRSFFLDFSRTSWMLLEESSEVFRRHEASDPINTHAAKFHRWRDFKKTLFSQFH